MLFLSECFSHINASSINLVETRFKSCFLSVVESYSYGADDDDDDGDDDDSDESDEDSDTEELSKGVEKL